MVAADHGTNWLAGFLFGQNTNVFCLLLPPSFLSSAICVCACGRLFVCIVISFPFCHCAIVIIRMGIQSYIASHDCVYELTPVWVYVSVTTAAILSEPAMDLQMASTNRKDSVSLSLSLNGWLRNWDGQWRKMYETNDSVAIRCNLFSSVSRFRMFGILSFSLVSGCCGRASGIKAKV